MRNFASGLIILFSFCQAVSAQVNVLTQHNDIGRTGQNTNETILTPANVSGGNFGKLFSVPVDGQVYAQPLYVAGLSIPGAGTHNVVYVATMHDSLYAFDADSGAGLWQITLLDAAHGAAPGATSDPISDTGCTESAGTEFGIYSTPVIDPVAGVIYVVGKTVENNYPVQRLHKLSLTTGAEMANSPVTLAASVAGTGAGSSNGILSFDPKFENQRAGLLLVNGIVYLAFAGYCDYGTWHGWILAYNTTTMQQTSAFTPTPNSEGSGIWMSGTGLAADIPAGSPFGRMFVPMGNGTYDAATPYGTNTMDYGVDVLRLDLTNGVMNITDAFTPFDQESLNVNDEDLASGGLMILPDQTLAGHTHQLLATGKTANMYLIDRENLGGYSTTGNNIIQYVAPPQIGSVFSAPAYWNNHVYYWGVGDVLEQFNFTNGLMNFWHSASSSEQQGYPGSTPSISANGIANGIVWNVDSSAWVNGGNAILLAHDANNVATTLYSSAANETRDNPGQAVKSAVPTISNGKVYVATYGQLSAYGLLVPDFSLTATPPHVSVQQGASAGVTITITAFSGFSGGVSLSANGLPPGLTAAFAVGSLAGTTNVTFSASTGTAAGSYAIGITGTAGSLTHSLSLTVTVTAIGAPTFSLQATPASLTLVQGQTASASLSVLPANGFNSAVALSAAGLPVGVSASFATASGGASVMTLSALATAIPQQFNVTVIGTAGSNSLTASTSIPVTLAPQPGFTLTAPVNSISVAVGQSGTMAVNITPVAGFNSPVTFSAVGLPSGVNAIFTPNPAASGTTVTFPVTNNLSLGNNTIEITGVSGPAISTVLVNVTVTATATPSFTLSAATNPLVLAQNTGGTSVVSVLPANGFNGTVTFSSSGLPPGASSAFVYPSATTGSTFVVFVPPTVPAGNYPLTVTGTSGSVAASTSVLLTVTGTPCTPTAITPYIQVNGAAWQQASTATVAVGSAVNLSPKPLGGTWSWTGPSGFVSSTREIDAIPLSPGTNTFVATYTNANACSSSQTFTINATGSVSVSLASAFNVYGIFGNGNSPANGGFDNDGYAYSANLLGSSISWAGSSFKLGAAGTADAVSGGTIALPAGNYAFLQLLAAGVNGNQANQTFIVTYTDGTSSTFSQSVSDWLTPQNYAGESTALSMSYRVTPGGGTQNGPFQIYGYSFALNSGKTVKSITLPNNRNLVVLAVVL
jgi:hypothetical protein